MNAAELDVPDDAVCRRCRYSLRGLTRSVCPECGLELVGRNVVSGRRPRLSRRVIIGILLVSVVSAACYFVSRIDVRRWYPLNWLMTEAESGDSRAMTEIYRRHELLELSAKQVSTIAEFAFHELSEKESSNRSRWLSLLAQLHICGDLTEEQNSRLAEELVQVRPHARSVIRQGDPVAIDIFWEAQSPNLWYQIALGTENRRVVVDGRVVHSEDKYQPIHWAYGRGSGVAAVVCDDAATLSPGIHDLTFTARVSFALYEAFSRVDHTSSRCGTYDISYTQQFEVLASESAETIHFESDAALASELAKLIEFRGLNVYVGECKSTGPSKDAKNAEIDGWIRLGDKQFGPSKALPVGVAFDLTLHVEEHSFHLGSLACPEGESLSHYLNSCISFPGDTTTAAPPTLDDWKKLFEGGQASLVLLTKRQLAYRRAAMTHCWEGELRIEPVSIVVSDFRRSSAQSEDRQQEISSGTAGE